MNAPKKFRKKPVVIEATQWDGTRAGSEPVLAWMHANGSTGYLHINCGGRETHLLIRTLEGDMIASSGDWIIKGIAGEFYPCKPEIFEATYETV